MFLLQLKYHLLLSDFVSFSRCPCWLQRSGISCSDRCSQTTPDENGGQTFSPNVIQVLHTLSRKGSDCLKRRIDRLVYKQFLFLPNEM